MADLAGRRMAAEIDGDFVVFLIGARVSKLHLWREVPWVKDLPSKYVERHFCLTTAPAHLPPDAQGREQLLEMLGGSSMLIYASDFPHDHGDTIAPLLEHLAPVARCGVIHDTGAAFYGLGAADPV